MASTSAADEPRVLLNLEGPLATLTLNRPRKLNAVDPPMLEQLEVAIDRLERDSGVRAVILTGAGERSFCVGADINAWAALRPLDMWRRWIREGHRVFERVARLRQPVIAALNGHTFGGGLEIALAADLRIAAAEAELAFPEVKLATIPGWAGTQRLPALIGAGRAKEMIFTGRRIDAATAERWGLVNEVVPREAVLERATEIAREIGANAPVSVQIAKAVIDGGLGQAGGVTLEGLAGALAAATADAQEGLAALRERRPPQFKGE